MKCQGPPWQYIGTIFQLKGPLELFAICYLDPRKEQSEYRTGRNFPGIPGKSPGIPGLAV